MSSFDSSLMHVYYYWAVKVLEKKKKKKSSNIYYDMLLQTSSISAGFCEHQALYARLLSLLKLLKNKQTNKKTDLYKVPIMLRVSLITFLFCFVCC